MNVTISYIAIAGIFLAGIIPVVMGIFQYIKENRKLDEVKRGKKQVPPQLKEEDIYTLM